MNNKIKQGKYNQYIGNGITQVLPVLVIVWLALGGMVAQFIA